MGKASTGSKTAQTPFLNPNSSFGHSRLQIKNLKFTPNSLNRIAFGFRFGQTKSLFNQISAITFEVCKKYELQHLLVFGAKAWNCQRRKKKRWKGAAFLGQKGKIERKEEFKESNWCKRKALIVSLTISKRRKELSEHGSCLLFLSGRLRSTLPNDGDWALISGPNKFPALQERGKEGNNDGKVRAVGVWECTFGVFRGISVRLHSREEAMKGESRWKVYGVKELNKREDEVDSTFQKSLFRDGKGVNRSVRMYFLVYFQNKLEVEIMHNKRNDSVVVCAGYGGGIQIMSSTLRSFARSG